MLQTGRGAVKNRENMRLTRTRYFGLSRDVYVQMGERLHEAGKLDEPRDIFYLDISELEAYHEGRSVGADLGGLARVRKAEFAEYEKQDVPHHFETIGAVYHGNQYKYEGEVEVDLNASTLMGVGCYPGVVESPIRLIFSPDDELSLNGKILCTVRTDPGWAPLFPTASGILVERGSTLSHSTVVAQELIPAVVGVQGSLKLSVMLKNVGMDGESSKIERLDHDPDAEADNPVRLVGVLRRLESKLVLSFETSKCLVTALDRLDTSVFGASPWKLREPYLTNAAPGLRRIGASYVICTRPGHLRLCWNRNFFNLPSSLHLSWSPVEGAQIAP